MEQKIVKHGMAIYSLNVISQNFVYAKYVNKSTFLLLTYEKSLGCDIKYRYY